MNVKQFSKEPGRNRKPTKGDSTRFTRRRDKSDERRRLRETKSLQRYMYMYILLEQLQFTILPLYQKCK